MVKYKVLRDLIQNFYDAVGYEEWHSNFFCDAEDGQLTFRSDGVNFSYDWLIHIGASTKREQAGKFAGYFGEGFKIAALCAIRDFNWHIVMSSRDWELEVTTAGIQVENQTLTSLAYRIKKLTVYHQNSFLRIHPFDPQDLDILESARYSFFYKENPLFGELIWQEDNAAVFHRSSVEKPSFIPSTYQFYGEGMIFAGYQALGSIPYPLVIALHDFRLDDRERNAFYKMDVVKVMNQVVGKLSAEASVVLLEILKNQWYANPKEKYGFESFCGIIRKLVQVMSQSSKQKECFKSNNSYLLVARPVKRNEQMNYNQRKQALAWLAQSAKPYRLVQDGFLLAGYPMLEEVCEQHGGFAGLRNPTSDEKKQIKLLEKLTSHILADFFDEHTIPPCQVIQTKDASWEGVASYVPILYPVSFYPIKT